MSDQANDQRGKRMAGAENDAGYRPGGSDADVAGLTATQQWPRLTPGQKTLASQHIGLVGVHLRNHVPTPRQPMQEREYDDPFQEGCVALVRAAARYKPGQDPPFPAYAFPRIRGAIFSAIHEQFTTIRIPAREMARARASGEPFPHPLQQPLDVSPQTPLALPSLDPTRPEDEETIRHAVRRRYEAVVARALDRLRRRRWRRRNPCAIMERIAAERLLISHERERTPLRRIGGDAGVSSGRVCAYERQLRDVVNEEFGQDTQLPLLLRFAREDPAGLNGLLDEERRERIARAEAKAFDARFAHLDRATRAGLVYRMIEQSSHTVAEVAHNLYRLTFRDGNDLSDQIRQIA